MRAKLALRANCTVRSLFKLQWSEMVSQFIRIHHSMSLGKKVDFLFPLEILSCIVN